MRKDNEPGAPPVRRITIDEKLTDDLMRILIADIKISDGAFDDDSSYWETEKELFVHPTDFREKMNMTKNDAKKWPWEGVHEGETFLQGYFKIMSGSKDKPGFIINRGRRNLQRIDSLIKHDIKRIYFSALEGGEGNGQEYQRR